METRIVADFFGRTQEAVNVEIHNNVIKPIEPKRNAVIVDFIESKDEDGGVALSTVVTVECKDNYLYETMKDYALTLARGIT
jgi:hypothetical protein